MIEIQDSKIIRDGEQIGTIVGDVAYVAAKPAPRIVGQIREAARMPQLAFTVGEQISDPVFLDKIRKAKLVLEKPPTTEESSEVQETESNSLTIEKLKQAQDICSAEADTFYVNADVPEQPAPLELPQKSKLPEPPRRPDMGDRDPVWQTWYITTHGETAFKARWPGRPMP